MANVGSLVAHFSKLIVTLICMRYTENSYTIFGNNDWAARAFQILLFHSILGILTFGTSGSLTGKRIFRNMYDSISNINAIVPFALLAMEIAVRCHVNETLRSVLLGGLIALSIANEIVQRKNRSKLRFLTDLGLFVQFSTITVACLKHGHASIISFVVSYVIERYFLEDICDRYDVPYNDLSQYSLSFVQVFALVTISDL